MFSFCIFYDSVRIFSEDPFLKLRLLWLWTARSVSVWERAMVEKGISVSVLLPLFILFSLRAESEREKRGMGSGKMHDGLMDGSKNRKGQPASE